MKLRLTAITFALLSSLAHPAIAAVTPEEAARLGNELTPLGAEKAGNAAGTIPEWTGGFQGSIEGDTQKVAVAIPLRARSRSIP